MTSFRSKQRFSLSGGSVGRPAVGVAVHRANVRPRGDGGHRCWRWRCSVGSDQLCWSIRCCRPAFCVSGCSTASRSALLVIFNAAIAVWPMVALNVTLTVFNVFYIVRLLRGRHDSRTFEVVEISPNEAYLKHLLQANARVVAATAGSAPETSPRLVAYLLQAFAAQASEPLPEPSAPHRMYRALRRFDHKDRGPR
jgi:hypothetical protein